MTVYLLSQNLCQFVDTWIIYLFTCIIHLYALFILNLVCFYYYYLFIYANIYFLYINIWFVFFSYSHLHLHTHIYNYINYIFIQNNEEIASNKSTNLEWAKEFMYVKWCQRRRYDYFWSRCWHTKLLNSGYISFRMNHFFT